MSEERTLPVPDDLFQALEGNEKARDAFNRLSYSHRREYIVWIEGAKTPQTREGRIALTFERLVEVKIIYKSNTYVFNHMSVERMPTLTVSGRIMDHVIEDFHLLCTSR